jgi:GDP/UDP-N,N'-diacetylbacillosamine 2-epimerase (hydrolysing)
MGELLAALDELTDVTLIFTLPNADTEGRALSAMVERYVAERPNAHSFASLGQLRYLSCLRYVDGVVGNSSSGLTEAPSFRIATINIGDRQRGRLMAESVVNCAADRESIGTALRRIAAPEFRSSLPGVRNPYGEGGASEKIVEVIRTQPLDNLIKKPFYDSYGKS